MNPLAGAEVIMLLIQVHVVLPIDVIVNHKELFELILDRSLTEQMVFCWQPRLLCPSLTNRLRRISLRLDLLHHDGASEYTDLEAVRAEVREARLIFAQMHWPVIDVTRRSIEETAASVMKLSPTVRRSIGPEPDATCCRGLPPLALKALVNHALGGDVTAGYVTMTTERLRGPARRLADRMKELCGITSSRHDPRPQKLAP
jgi:hypothetical protein